MKILVTGANGFLGTHLAHKLLSQGHTVYGLVRNPKTITFSHQNFVVVKGDLNSPQPSWMNLIPSDLEVCIHTAGLVHTYLKAEFYKVNAEGTRILVESLKSKIKNNESFKFILISSLAAAGPVNFGEVKKENEPDFPVSTYGRSKKIAEEILKDLAPKVWTTSIVRPPMIIGPGDVAVLDIFKMVKSRFIILPGCNSKKKEYSFVCVFDLVETIIKVLESPQSFTLYSAHDDIITFLDLINEIKKRMGIRFLIYLPIPLFFVRLLSLLLAFIYTFFKHSLRLTPDKILELKSNAWNCENGTSKNILVQEYKYPLNETVKITYEDYKKRKWI
jgi:nucleoside-diphosphate-sugar epimerase